ncbi:MAG: cytochrome c [Verrucomicrobiales bacterium]|nr:cytochrome c [Verrucomicrobiales bacterium]
MNTNFRQLAMAGVALVLSGVAGVAADAWLLPPETAKLKAGPGVELATTHCLLCHSADYVSTQPRLTRAGWEASVKKMREKYGAPIPAGQVTNLVDYLTQVYGKPTPSGK